MREKFALNIDRETLAGLTSETLPVTNFLKAFFGEPGSVNYEAMCQGLVAYHNKDGGSPEVIGFEIADAGFNMVTGLGYLKCAFAIHFHYTCSDVHSNSKDIITWDFKPDATEGLICFTGEEPWVRDAE